MGRTHGEGTVYQVRPGLWRAQRSIGGQRLGATGPTPAEARRRLEARVQAATEARPGPRELVANFLDAWVEESRGSVKPTTWRQRRYLTARHVVPYLGHLQMDEVRPYHLTELYEGLRGGSLRRLPARAVGRPPAERLGDTTIRHIHSLLRQAFDEAVSRCVCSRNPARQIIRGPRAGHREKIILSQAQMTRLLDAAREARLGALFTLAATTGMRQGEIIGLMWRDVDLRGATLAVLGNAQRDYDGRLEIGTTKTRSSTRTIALPAVAVDALRRHRAVTDIGSMLVFPSPNGNLLNAPTLRDHHFRPLLAAAGLPPMPFHDLRHSYATLALRAGVPIEVVSATLGHASPAITYAIYIHATREVRTEAATTMDRLFGGGSAALEDAL